MPASNIQTSHEHTHTLLGRPARFSPEWDRFTDAQKSIILADTEAQPGLLAKFNARAAEGLRLHGLTSTRIKAKFFVFGMDDIQGAPMFCVDMVIVSAETSPNGTHIGVAVRGFDIVM